mmetsp:Transcript_11737/g.17780  ORF Transcript_11737/g.17780 Transcript_11737/m.17780 type:complete len:575 (+) Transcript_11737:103-1827(+)
MDKYQHQRFLLVSSGVTCGIFKCEAYGNTVTVLLSAEADFALISFGCSSETHLTRFVPSKFRTIVKETLLFRNSVSHLRPYCVPVYFGSDLYCDEKVTEWKLSDLAIQPSGQWKKFMSSDGTCCISVCPFQRRVRYSGPVLYHPENITGRDDYKDTYVTVQNIYYPIQRCPSDVKELLQLLQRNTECTADSEEPSTSGRKTRHVITNHIRSNPCGARHSTSALTDFQRLSEELHLLSDPEYFPTCDLVVVERIDNMIYTYSGACGGLLSDPYKEVEVEAWIDYHDWSKNDWVSAQMISLRHCYVRYECIHPHSTSVTENTLHLSVFEAPVEVTEDITGSKAPLQRMLLLRKHVVHLENLRTHICGLHPILTGCVDKFRLPLGLYRLPAAPPSFSTTRPSPVAGYTSPLLPRSVCPVSYSSTGDPRSAPRPLVVATHRTASGDCLTLLADGRVRGVFPSERTVVEYIPGAEVVRAVLPDGNEVSLSISSVINAAIDRSHVHNHSPRCSQPFSDPADIIANNVLSMLSFRRHSQLPEHLRGQLCAKEKQISIAVVISQYQNAHYLSKTKNSIGTPT